METEPERAMAIMLGLGDGRVLGVGEDDEGLVAEVETGLDPATVRCPHCFGPVVADGIEEREQERPPTFGRATLFVWMLRRFRCENAGCPVGSFVEELPPVKPA